MANGDNAEPSDEQDITLPAAEDMSIEDWLALMPSGDSPANSPLAPIPPSPARAHHSAGMPTAIGLPPGPATQQIIGGGNRADPLRINPAFVPGVGHYGNPDFYAEQYRQMFDPTGMQAWAAQNEIAALMALY